MEEQVRHWPSAEQVAQSAGQGTHRPSLLLGIVPVGQVETQSPVEVANSSGLAQDEHCVAVVWHVEHFVVSQAVSRGTISLMRGQWGFAQERKLTFTSPVDIGRTLGKEETRATLLHTLIVLQYPALLTGRTRRVVPDRGDRE
jgi:hypothetical protein